MAFRSFTSGTRDAGTVTLRADTGQFNADVEAAERQWRESVGSMSREALKLELAQKRLASSLDKYGAESDQAKRATIALKDAEEQSSRAADRAGREYQQQERSLGRLTRGAVAGTGVLHGLGRSIAFASGTFLGGAGLVYALRSTVEAGRRAEASQGRVAVAVRNAGIDYAKYRVQIHDTIEAQSRLSAFDDEDLADSFGRLVTRTKDVREALKDTALAADVARGRNISLEAATQLVIKASLNQAGQLRRVGLEVGKNTTAQELLNKLTEAYSGQAARYGREGAGAQERLGVAIQNTQEDIARGLLPAVTNLSNRISDWLGKSQNQERIQKDVNEAVHAGTEVVKGLAGALRIVKAAAEPVVGALGGIENTVKLAGLLWVAFKVKALAGFAGTALASKRTAASMVEDAAVAGRAWDVATRPRSMVITTTTTGGGGGVPTGGGGAPGVPTERPRFPGTTGTRGTGLVGIAGVALAVFGLEALTKPPSLREQQRKVADMSRVDKRRAIEMAQSFSQTFGTPIGQLVDDNPLLQKYGSALPSQVASAGLRTRPDEGTRGAITNRANGDGGRGGTGAGGGGGGTTGDGLTRFQRLTLAAQAADNSGDLRAELRASKALEAYYAQIASNKKLHGDKLFQARQDLLNQQGRTQAIEDQIAADAQQAQQTATTKRKANRTKLAAARKKAAAAELRDDLAEARSLSIGAKKQLKGRFPMGDNDRLERIQAGVTKAAKEQAAPDFGPVIRDFMQFQHQFLTGLISDFLGGTGAGNALQTHALEQFTLQGNSELKQQTGLLKTIAQHRGSGRGLDEALMS